MQSMRIPLPTIPWYKKYASGMKGYLVIFWYFISIFLYNCFGMRSMRFPPDTRPWYETRVFCVF